MRRFICAALAAALLASLAGCGGKKDYAEAVKARGTLTVLLAEGDDSFVRLENGEWTGIEPELAKRVAAELGVPLAIETCPKSALKETFKSGTADFALGREPYSDSVRLNFLTGVSYGGSSIFAVTPRGVYFPTTSSLAGAVIGTSAQLSESASILTAGIADVSLLSYSDISEAANALVSGNIAAYICYEGEAFKLAENTPGVQAQNLYGAERERFVPLARQGAESLMFIVNSIVTADAEAAARQAEEQTGEAAN